MWKKLTKKKSLLHNFCQTLNFKLNHVQKNWPKNGLSLDTYRMLEDELVITIEIDKQQRCEKPNQAKGLWQVANTRNLWQPCTCKCENKRNQQIEMQQQRRNKRMEKERHWNVMFTNGKDMFLNVTKALVAIVDRSLIPLIDLKM